MVSRFFLLTIYIEGRYQFSDTLVKGHLLAASFALWTSSSAFGLASHLFILISTRRKWYPTFFFSSGMRF